MYTSELGFPVIDNVRAIAKVEIDNVHTVYLADVFIAFSAIDVFGYQLGYAEQHTLEVGILIVVLNFDDKKLAIVVFSKDIYTIMLVELVFLVTFAFQ